MGMIWNVIKLSGGDIWEEFLYLIIFNVVWLLGSLFILPFPYLTFGLYFTAYEIGHGKAIKFSTFFVRAAPFWRQAYIWGGINLVAAIILWFNFKFYANFEAQWATMVQMVFLAMAIFWSILQLITLPMYPRLEEPGFKLALRNAVVVVSRYPVAALVLSIIVALIVVVSSFFPAVAFLGLGSFTAILTNRMVQTIVERELDRDA